MIVLWDQGLVLLATPKTATTALLGGLRKHATMIVTQPPELKHAPYYRYKRFLEPYFKKAGKKTLDTVAVVREPVDWLGSWYRYRNRDQLVDRPNSTRGISFDDFVEEYLADKPRSFARVGSQSKFLRDGDGSIGVTYLFAYENLDDMVAFFAERIGEEIELPVRNVSPEMQLSLDPGLRTRFMAERPEEFEAWNAALPRLVGAQQGAS